MTQQAYIDTLRIQGYTCFKDTQFTFKPLQIIVGPNGSGKSNLINFFELLRDIATRGFHKELLDTQSMNSVFHPGGNTIEWEITLTRSSDQQIYAGKIHDNYKDFRETLSTKESLSSTPVIQRTNSNNTRGMFQISPVLGLSVKDRIEGKGFNFEESLNRTAIYRSFNGIERNKINTAQLVSDDTVLSQDYKNISSLLHNLKLQNLVVLAEIEHYLQESVPGFDSFSFKTGFGAGKVMAFYKEKNSPFEFSLDGLSDGTLRLLCWLIILLSPEKPRLLLFDEPEIGLHPRTMELLAALIKKASFETQVIVTTHNPYFLSLFDAENVAVMKRESNNIGYYPVTNSKVLRALLDDEFGGLEELFLTGELDSFSSDE